MLSTNLRDYVKIYNNFIDDEVCKGALKHLENFEWHAHVYSDISGNRKSFDEQELSITYTQTIRETQIVQEKIWHAIDKYVKELNLPYFNGWSGYTQVRFNRYNTNTMMRVHCDHIHSMFDGDRKGIPTLSVLGALNDDYEGGDLLFWDDEKIELKAGSIMIFPSNFLYPHRVSLVTKGTRYSYVSWVW